MGFHKTCGIPHVLTQALRLKSSVESRTRPNPKNVAGPFIRKARYAAGMSQPELAAKCQRHGWNISRDIVARIELQTRWLADFELQKMANVLGVTIGDLIPRQKRIIDEACALSQLEQ